MLVVTINLPQIGILNKGDEEGYFKMLDKRMELVKKALMLKHKLLEGTKSDVSPIHWQHGAIARLKSGETIDKLLHGGYSTISIGYIGIYEATKLVFFSIFEKLHQCRAFHHQQYSQPTFIFKYD